MSKRVYVAGLPSNATEEQVLKLFDRSGRIWRGVFKHGYAFLDFDTHDDARNAIKMHDGELFLGRRLIVEWGYSQPSKEDVDRETTRRSDLSAKSVPIDARSADKSEAEYGVTLTGLPSTAGYQELRGLVSRHCSGVKDLVLGPDARNAAGTAHVVFDSLSMARAAMRELNGIRLRGFRIQSWGMTPEEMGNLVKWGRIKLPSSPVSRSSLAYTANTSALGSPGRRIADARRAQGRDHRRASRSRSRSRQRSPLPRYSSPAYSRHRPGYSDDHSRRFGSSRTSIPEANRDGRRYYEPRPSHRDRSRSPFVRSGRRSPSPRSDGWRARRHSGNAPYRDRSPSPRRNYGTGPRMSKDNGPRRYRSHSRSPPPRRQSEPRAAPTRPSAAHAASTVNHARENKSLARSK